MGNKSILFIGLLISILYISGVVYFNKNLNKDNNSSIVSKKAIIAKEKEKIKFLLSLKKKHVDIISKLPIDGNISLAEHIDILCDRNSCSKNIKYEANINKNNKIINLLKKYLQYINDHNLYKASIIVNGNNIEINYLVKNKRDLIELSKLSKNIDKNINIINSSSIVEVFNIDLLQKEIENILSDKKIQFNKKDLTEESKIVLDSAFKKIKDLGYTKLIFNIDLNESKMQILKDYILNKYPFILDVKMIKNKKNKIEIKEIS